MSMKRTGAEPARPYSAVIRGALTFGAALLICASCGSSKSSQSAAETPAVDLGLMTPSTYCGLTSSRFEFRSQPQSGYSVLLVIDSYHGVGNYIDITKDQDSASGTKLTIYSVSQVPIRVVRGIAASGTVSIESAAGNLMTGRFKVHVIDDASKSRSKAFEVTGSWICFLTLPGSASPSQAPSPVPAGSP
jgi:hypothetical protein